MQKKLRGVIDATDSAMPPCRQVTPSSVIDTAEIDSVVSSTSKRQFQYSRRRLHVGAAKIRTLGLLKG